MIPLSPPASSLVPELFLTKAKVILFWQHKCEEIYQWLDKKVFWRGLHYRPFKFSGLRRISVDGNRGMGGTINQTQPVKIQNNHWKSNKQSRKFCPSSRCRVIVSSRGQFWKCKRYFKFGLRCFICDNLLNYQWTENKCLWLPIWRR